MEREKRREKRREEDMKVEERSAKRKWHKQSMYRISLF